MFDGQQLGEDVVGIVRSFMEREFAPLKAENESLKQRIVALEARPAPERGEKGDPGERGTDGNNGADGKDGRDGKDGASIVAPVKDNGELCFTLDNGQLIRTGIRDGEPGKDGRDGFSLDHFDIQPTDERTIEMIFEQGDRREIYELVFPVPVYRDVFKEGEEYQRGDLVTWGGSLWHCDRPTKAKPGTDDWTLAVKRGRDGKDAKPNG